MPMKNPPHPGKGLKSDIKALGLTVTQAAKGLGVTRQRLLNLLNGKRPITAEMAVRLEKGLGSTADFWLRLQASHDLAQVRHRKKKVKVKRFWRSTLLAAE